MKFTNPFFSSNFKKQFEQRRIFEQVVKSTYNMISRALPKDEHFALALHILKGAHPELVPEKVNYFLILPSDIFYSISNYQKLFLKICRNGNHLSQISL